MSVNDRTRPLSVKCRYALIALALVGAAPLAGCDATNPSDDEEAAEVVIVPDSASLAVGDEVDFAVVAVTASGDTIRDVSASLRWWSTDPSVFTVGSGGLARAQQTGVALCKVEVAGETSGKRAASALRRFTGRDSAFVSVF